MSFRQQTPKGLEHLDIIRHRLNQTLQGYIHSVRGHSSDTNIVNPQTVIVKQTLKHLVSARLSHHYLIVAEDFKQEVRILRYISKLKDVDPVICCITNDSVWEDDDNYYYTMEYCESELMKFIQDSFRQGTMGQFIQNRVKDPSNIAPCTVWIEKIQNMFQQLVRCVGYLHKQGIAHRDLSLENAMLLHHDSTDIKIIDFGVAYDIRQHNNSWICYDCVGKRSYMAPEVFARHSGRKYDARAADIWCLGIMLFMMLTNCIPINENNRTFVVYYFLNGYFEDVIKQWEFEHFFTDEIIDLLNQIFKCEKERITMEELLAHPFVGLS